MSQSKNLTGAQVAEILNRAIDGANFLEHYRHGCLWAFGPCEHKRDDGGELRVHTDAFGVWAQFDSREQKISLSAHIPNWAHSHLWKHGNPETTEGINVSPNREPAAIGKDIERRFLAPWREVWPQLEQVARKRQKDIENRDSKMESVAREFGWSNNKKGSDRLYGGDGIYNVYFGSDSRIGSFEVSADLTPEAFVQVVQLIQALRTDR